MTAVGSDLRLVGDLAACVTVSTLLDRCGHVGHRLPGVQVILSLRPAGDLARPFDADRSLDLRWQPAPPPAPWLSYLPDMSVRPDGPAHGPAQLTVVTMTRSARNAISSHLAQNDADDEPGRETGGVLLGHDTGSRLAITHAGGPGPSAVRTERSFRRDVDHTRRFAELVHAEAGSQWIGEWHSHPIGPALPSERDIATYRDFLADNDLALRVFVALIAVVASPRTSHLDTVRSSGWEFSTWLLDRDVLLPKRLHLV